MVTLKVFMAVITVITASYIMEDTSSDLIRLAMLLITAHSGAMALLAMCKSEGQKYKKSHTVQEKEPYDQEKDNKYKKGTMC